MGNDQIHTPIIPIDQIFYDQSTKQIIPWDFSSTHPIDLRAVSVFISVGFFLDDDTYYKNIKTCHPASTYYLNNKNCIEKIVKNWNWHYTPSDLSFDQTVDNFVSLFEKIIHSQTKDKNILLPISGGLDSRTLLVPVKNKSDITLCSYEFEGGYNETGVGRLIAEKLNAPFYSQIIPKGYLWENLKQITDYNGCFTDLTHPRHAAVMNNWKGLGDVLLLGHWGDVLFDSHLDRNNYSYDEQIIILKNKLINPVGQELADELWKYWGFEGSFNSYLTNRLDNLYRKINIEHISARMRAFKSIYWAPRWTSINLAIFRNLGDLVLPYYNDEMCKFICTVPERFLKGRKIQIEYIKKFFPELANMPWQKYHPLNLSNYNKFNNPIYFPIRFIRKLNRLKNEKVFKHNTLNQRNWELQFLGQSNIANLKKHLLSRTSLNDIIPNSLIKNYLKNFQSTPFKYSHSMGMLLTLAKFFNKLGNT